MIMCHLCIIYSISIIKSTCWQINKNDVIWTHPCSRCKFKSNRRDFYVKWSFVATRCWETPFIRLVPRSEQAQVSSSVTKFESTRLTVCNIVPSYVIGLPCLTRCCEFCETLWILVRKWTQIQGHWFFFGFVAWKFERSQQLLKINIS